MRFGVPTAIAVLFAGLNWSAPAMASNLGCQVLLCLSNPGGPPQYSACVPPITKLWRELAAGSSFPTCTQSGVARTKTRGKRGITKYRATMTYTSGSQKSYSLGDIYAATLPAESAPQHGGTDRQ